MLIFNRNFKLKEMTKNQKDQYDRQSDNTVNQLTAGNENPQVYHDEPLANKPSKDVRAKLNYDDLPAGEETGAEEPGKYDFTLYDEEPPIFNYY